MYGLARGQVQYLWDALLLDIRIDYDVEMLVFVLAGLSPTFFVT